MDGGALRTRPWASAEDKVVCNGVELHGFKWSHIASALPGRTPNAVRNRWNRLEKDRLWRENLQAQYQADATVEGATTGPEALARSVFQGYACRRCGQPKRGHSCPYEDTTPRLLALPLPTAAPCRAPSGRKRARAHAVLLAQAGAPAPNAQLATPGSMHTLSDLAAAHLLLSEERLSEPTAVSEGSDPAHAGVRAAPRGKPPRGGRSAQAVALAADARYTTPGCLSTLADLAATQSLLCEEVLGEHTDGEQDSRARLRQQWAS